MMSPEHLPSFSIDEDKEPSVDQRLGRYMRKHVLQLGTLLVALVAGWMGIRAEFDAKVDQSLYIKDQSVQDSLIRMILRQGERHDEKLDMILVYICRGRGDLGCGAVGKKN